LNQRPNFTEISNENVIHEELSEGIYAVTGHEQAVPVPMSVVEVPHIPDSETRDYI
jgi:hypothetical protein